MPRDDIIRRFPVLSRHWPNFPPDTPGDEPPPCVCDIRFRRNVAKLHRLGPRVLHEYLIEVGAQRGIRTFLEDKTGDYAALDRRLRGSRRAGTCRTRRRPFPADHLLGGEHMTAPFDNPLPWRVP